MLTPTTRRSLLAVAIPAAALIPAAAAGQDTPAAPPQQPPRPPQHEQAPIRPECHTQRCRHRVAHREVRRRWRAAVRRYGPGRLRARMQCESGHDGGYRLDTTGNGFWYAHQFERRAWTGAGGRTRRGRPVGAWSWHPSKLEQDVRAVIWDAMHPGDPWPNCP